MFFRKRTTLKDKSPVSVGNLGMVKVRSLLFASMIDAIIGIVVMTTDKVILGSMIGSDAVSATMLVGPIVLLSEIFTSLISNGASILYTRAIGDYDTDRSRKIFGMSVVMIMIILGDNLFVIMGVEGRILEYGIQYIHYFRFFLLIFPLYSFLSDIVYTDGDEIRGIISNIAIFFGNVVLTILLIPRMGIRGASLGSFIAVLLAFAVTVSHFFSKKYRLIPVIAFDPDILKEMCMIGGMDALDSAADCLYAFLVELFVIRVLGSEYLAVVAVTGLVYEMMGIGSGISDAMKTMLIAYWGDKNREAMKSLLNYVIRLTLKICMVYIALVWLLSPILPQLFGIDTPELSSFTVTVCRIVSFSSLACIFYGLFMEYYSSIGKYGLTLTGNLLDSLVIRLLLVTAFGVLFGPVGLWIGESLCTYACIGVLSLIVIKKYGGKKYPLLIDEETGSSMNLSYLAEVDEIIDVRDRVGAFLTENGVIKNAVNFCMLLLEDFSMLIKEENSGNKSVHVDAFVTCDRKNARFVLWYEGIIVDMSNPDRVPNGIRAYLVSSLFIDFKERKYQNTAGYNRASFIVPFKKFIREQIGERTNE